MRRRLLYFGVASLLLTISTSCENDFNEFPNSGLQTVYFATQYAERTLVLGEDITVDNTMDNEHKISIKAVWGGGYNNPENVTIGFVIDESLCNNLRFQAESGEGNNLVPMPFSYYEMASDRISIPAGQISGGVEVKLTDEFFADPKSVENYYVIPLRMTYVTGADSILQGSPAVADPVLTNSTDWSVQPQNFVLYAVKYVNVWHGEYLRRGIDRITTDYRTEEVIRHAEFVQDDEVAYLKTRSLTNSTLALTAQGVDGNNVSYEIDLAFDEDGNCTMSSLTDGVDVKGEGKFVKDGEKNSLGGKDRDALYLNYTVKLPDNRVYVTSDTLVLRARGVQGGKSFTAVQNQ